MSKPAAYDPQQGYKYQILCRQFGAYEHCDYAKDRHEKNELIANYQLAYGPGWEFQSYTLPQKYWPTWEVWDCLCYEPIKEYKYKDCALKHAQREIKNRNLPPNSIIVREKE